MSGTQNVNYNSDRNENKQGKKKWLLLLLLLLIFLICFGVTIWALGFRHTAPDLTPDYAPHQLEQNAKPIGDEEDDKLDQPQGGGAVSLTYSRQVTVDLSDKTASLLFGNPTKSNQDMIVQLVIQDSIIIQSGLLKPGNQVTSLDLLDGADEQLSPGGYDGKFVVLYYQQESGEKAIVNIEIPVIVAVEE